ncbi:MAG: exodeoxyribonuclease VII large subunit [Oscillospiraceae bacterium]|nr:exodeoxyribonuclease VII large subunit [Oscillospiraceae bacterium]MBR4691583.1 exodeoxyribonuclease VII large subunit [Oscillospiraceae bacterium]
MSEKVWSVGELTKQIRDLLEGEPFLQRVFVRGELSNYKVYPSGHHYFTVKDEEATLKAVMFRREASRLRFQPESGMRVIALGRIGVYPRDGAYQLYVTELVPDGVGDLHAAFEQLKEKLGREGLFEASHKKPLPPYPERIAVVTSSAGAAVRDVIRVATARFPAAKLIVMPVRVQGTEAPPEIVSAIRYANQWRVADLIITGRGGGSIEDLWAFNDERVARAIYESEIPVISAVGHEPDVTIADFVADVRAATPSNAAELAVPDRQELLGSIAAARRRMEALLSARLGAEREKLRQLAGRRVLQDPSAYLADRRIALDHTQSLLLSAYRGLLAKDRALLGSAAAALDAMSPLKVLARGYAIAETADGRILRSKAGASAGDRLRLLLADGELPCLVMEEEKE